MILQALYDYYQRKAADPESHIAPLGLQWQEIKFIIVIDSAGQFIDLQDTRGEDGRGRKYLVPKSIKRAGSKAYETAFLLWDHYGYVLNHPKNDDESAKKMADLQHQSFLKVIDELPENIKKNKELAAVHLFYKKQGPIAVKNHRNWQDCAQIPGCNLSFQLLGETRLVPESEAIRQFISSKEQSTAESEDEIVGRCLITGLKAPIARLHTATPIRDSKSNATIVAFQKNSGYDSYGKEQAYNAPISQNAEAAYSTALKELLTSQKNKTVIAGSTILFWAIRKERKNNGFDLEESFQWFFSEDRDDPDRSVKAVKSLYDAVHTGQLPRSEDKFYILSLSPNAARISIRFFRQGSINEIGSKIYQHFNDLEICKAPHDPEYLSLYRLLTATALQYKMDNVPPNLASAVLVSVLDGTAYPETLLQQCIRRIRAEREVTRARAAIIKATINRNNRLHKPSEKEITMALDPTNTKIGYLLGRLFAVLEKIQEEASPGLNATIRDRFFGAASSTPVTVFSQLLKLKNHHVAKLENPGRRIFFEKLVGEIVANLSEFPSHLAFSEQAYFSIGYYHQRQDFFMSRKNENESKQL